MPGALGDTRHHFGNGLEAAAPSRQGARQGQQGPGPTWVADSSEEQARRSKAKSRPRRKTATGRVVLERDRWIVWCWNALMVTTHLINGHSASESRRGDRAS